MMPLISSCCAVAVLVGPAGAMMGQNSPQDYPQWRGQNRDGAASAFFIKDLSFLALWSLE